MLCDPRYLGRLFTGEQLTTATGWLVEDAQSSADATAQASSASPPSADDRSVMNALRPLLNTGTSHSPSSTIVGEVERYLASPAVDWWRENEQGFPSFPCVAVTAMF